MPSEGLVPRACALLPSPSLLVSLVVVVVVVTLSLVLWLLSGLLKKKKKKRKMNLKRKMELDKGDSNLSAQGPPSRPRRSNTQLEDTDAAATEEGEGEEDANHAMPIDGDRQCQMAPPASAVED